MVINIYIITIIIVFTFVLIIIIIIVIGVIYIVHQIVTNCHVVMYFNVLSCCNAHLSAYWELSLSGQTR